MEQNIRLKEKKSADEQIRLNKFLSDAGYCSRREADRLVEQGVVKVNGKTAVMGQKVTINDSIMVKGKNISREEEQILIALNKPVGIECTTDLNNPDNIVDFINFDKELDTTQLGEQVINASVEDNMGNVATKTFTFNVGDTSAPEMNLKNGNFVVNYGDNFDINNYVEAKDNYDMNPVLSVEGEIDTKKLDGTQPIKVTATDASGNKTENTYDVTVADIAAPAITLKSTDINVKNGGSFDAKSNIASAIDNLDGDVTSKVNVSGSVNTSKAGSYTVNYTVTDNAGNTANTSAKVTVAAAPSRGGYNAGGTSVKGGHSGIVGTGLSKVGSAYVFGASGPTAFDCSGFTSWVYRQNGKSLPRTASAQYSGTTRVSKDGLSAGDLVFFAGTYKSGISHVGIYIGNGQFVHAANSSTGVTVSSLNSGYYASHYAGAGR